ncbi:hypothetical protein MYG64_36275 (plasmid) [Ensifer adhaerens]|uniref:hypothetical protein n=1 Tax=Ensifer adhaerens TaxID=106592 RepID=UPI002100951B|nr:hypothetical protein [Ensifer adhaerens]UTV41919.1 hypothetical protein MYG64_36275 [Ensifer adhaerens]
MTQLFNNLQRLARQQFLRSSSHLAENNFQAALGRAQGPQLAHNNHGPRDTQTPGGVIIHKIKCGDTAIDIGEGLGYSLDQLQLMNPALRDNPNVIVEGGTLTILDQRLFNNVKAAAKMTDEAVSAQASYENMTTNLDNVPPHVRKLMAIEAPSVRQTAADKRRETAALLTPGLLEEGLANALDERAMNKALDAHAAAIAPVGDGHPGFDAIINEAKSGARDQINDIFGRKVELTDQSTGRKRTANLRELMAEAKDTPTASRQRDASAQWQNVQHGMVALMDGLSQEAGKANGGEGANKALIQTEAVQNVAQILAAATPNRGTLLENDPYISTVNVAADEVLVMRSVKAVNNAANDLDAALDSVDSIPELAELVEQTEGIDRDLAVRRIEGSQSAVGSAIFDLFRNQVDHGMGAIMADDRRVQDAMTKLTILADRIHTSKGEETVQDLASSIVRVIYSTGEKSRQSSESLAIQIGSGLKEAIASGHSPALAQEVARQLMHTSLVGTGNKYEKEASSILRQASMGVEKLQETADTTGKEFYEKIVYVAELGRQNIGESSKFSHEGGVNSLLESEKKLVEKTDHFGEAIVLTLASTQELPSELQGLEGARHLQDARNALKDEVNQDIVTGKGKDAAINSIPLLTQSSPSAALASQRVAQDAALDRMKDVPAEDLNRLVEELGKLPAGDPYSQMATQLQSLKDPKTVLHENPALTLALLDRFSTADQSQPDVRPAPNAGFLSRAGRDVLLEVFKFQTQGGGGLIPGIPPIQPSADTRSAAMDRRLDALKDRLSAQSGTAGRLSGLTGVARNLWLKTYPIQAIEARTGLNAHTPSIPFVNTGSALLNLWGTATLTRSDVPMDQAWGWYFAGGAAKDLALAVDGTRGLITGRAGFSQIAGLRGWEWLPRIYNGAGVALAVLQLGHELGKGDLPMAAAWLPGTAASIYAAMPGAVAAGPVVTIGFLLTAGLVTGISQYRHVQDANRLEGPLGAYLKGAAPGVEKPESLANCDENGVPYLALNPTLAKAQGVSSSQMIEYLYGLDKNKRDRMIDYALQMKSNDDGEFPIKKDPDEKAGAQAPLMPQGRGVYVPPGGRYPAARDTRIQRHQIASIEDFQRWARENNYRLPTG